MDKTSTLNSTDLNRAEVKKSATKTTKHSTLAFIRQFARTYMAVENMPGLILN